MPPQLPHYTAIERLLCLSNGHGEDVIAAQILQALQQIPNAPKLAALPLVGEGRAYQQLGISIIGPVKSMPSGGFVYMDGRQLARDVQGGLLQLTLAQFRAIREWTRQGGSVLAVGDIFPLLLAYLSGAPYGFVGTAKSEYYLRDDDGKLFPQTFLDGWSGSVYYPWERLMMACFRCRAVFPRDTITTKTLQKWSIPAFDLGNPMMDGLQPEAAVLTENKPATVHERSRNGVEVVRSLDAPQRSSLGTMTVALIPGSRVPEAYENWQLILQAVDGLVAKFSNQLLLLGAIAPTLSLEPLIASLVAQGWQPCTYPYHLQDRAIQPFSDPHAYWFRRERATIGLTQYAYADCLYRADWAIALAGTATEQFVGLGKPAIIFPGKGPQFTRKFAEAQTRLLGESVILVEEPSQAAIAIQTLMQNPDALQRIARNGQHRMGKPGAAKRIAQCLMQQLAPQK